MQLTMRMVHSMEVLDMGNMGQGDILTGMATMAEKNYHHIFEYD